MADEPFEKLDESLMKEFTGLREKKVSPEILERFGDSVIHEIQKRQSEKTRRPNWLQAWIPAFVPVLAVLVIFVGVGLLWQFPGTRKPFSLGTSLPVAFSVASDLSEEITALEELGEWTEEDDAAVDVSSVS